MRTGCLYEMLECIVKEHKILKIKLNELNELSYELLRYNLRLFEAPVTPSDDRTHFNRK